MNPNSTPHSTSTASPHHITKDIDATMNDTDASDTDPINPNTSPQIDSTPPRHRNTTNSPQMASSYHHHAPHHRSSHHSSSNTSSNTKHQHSHVKTIFISNLPPDTSQREIYLLFRDQDAYTDCILLQKPDTPPCAFVSFATHEHAVRAMEKMQGTQFDPNDPENRIRIALAKNDTRKGFGERGNAGNSSISQPSGNSQPTLSRSGSGGDLNARSTQNNRNTSSESTKYTSHHTHKRSRKNTTVLEKDNHTKRMRLTSREYYVRSPLESRGMEQHSSNPHAPLHGYPPQPPPNAFQPHLPPFNQYHGMPTQPFLMSTPPQYAFPNVDPSHQLPPHHHPYFVPHQPQFAAFQPYTGMAQQTPLHPSGYPGGPPQPASHSSPLNDHHSMHGSPSHSSPRAKRRRRDQSPSPMQQNEHSPSPPPPPPVHEFQQHSIQQQDHHYTTLRIPLLRDSSQERQLQDISSNLKGFVDIEKRKDHYFVCFETEIHAAKALDILRGLQLSGDASIEDVEFFVSGSD